MSAVTIERPPKKAVFNKQKVRRGLTTTVGISRRIFTELCRKDAAISLALVLVLIASALGVVASGHANRALFNDLSELHAQRDNYEREWSQLLLEESTLSAHSGIEQRASDQLGMVLPDKNSIVLVPARR